MGDLDLEAVLDELVAVLNLPAPGGLRSVDSAFNALKDEPSQITAYPRAYTLDIVGETSERGAQGEVVTEGGQNVDFTIQVGLAVAPASWSRTQAAPKARAFIKPFLDLLDLHFTLNGTVEYLRERIRWEMGVFQPPAQQHFGLLFYVPYRIIRDRSIAP